MRLGGNVIVDDQLNVPLEDVDLLAEIELTTNLIIAATESDRPLEPAEIDRILGLEVKAPRIPDQQPRSD